MVGLREPIERWCTLMEGSEVVCAFANMLLKGGGCRIEVALYFVKQRTKSSEELIKKVGCGGGSTGIRC